MGKSERNWHQNFIDYMEFIVSHPHYNGLPIERKSNGELSWIATAKSSIGLQRKNWADNKAEELGIQAGPGVYARVMLEVHPTKKKVCQVCGNEMSLYYLYPNHHMVNALEKSFNYKCDMNSYIINVVNDLLKGGFSELQIKDFFVYKIGLADDFRNKTLQEVIMASELRCRSGNSSMLGPGAMSNFPDRYDGFHTYNRCCRSTEDTGRHKENLKSYTKDRRAYEYWSDGNIHAANQFMGSSYFQGTSADHLGPISLGFVHDPRYLRQMSKGDNSSKRDRLLYEDIQEIVSVELQTGVPAMSWYSALIWNHLKANFNNKPFMIESYRVVLKQNMATFMYILGQIIENNTDKGIQFLVDKLLMSKMQCFEYNYRFNALGQIIDQSDRNITDSTRKEFERFVRIAIESVYDYNDKENRNFKVVLSNQEQLSLNLVCSSINLGNIDYAWNELLNLIQAVQLRLINSL